MMNPESLLDFSKPLNVELFDRIIKSFFQGKTEYQNVLVKFQNHPQAWLRVHDILEKSQMIDCKIIGLNILESCVKTRWNILPKQQKDGMKTYVVNLIIKLSSDSKTLKQFSKFIRKLNIVLVQIVKQDWPQNWPNFIPELVNSSKSSQQICTNNMQILLLLSEEVFDFSSGHMTQKKIKQMKANLNREFTLIFQLCEYILDNSQDPNLLTMTLQTLLRFLKWIPVGYIFETKLIETLAVKFFPVALFQTDTLSCLTEIGSLKLNPPKPQYNPKFIQMFMVIMTSAKKFLGTEINIAHVYANGDVNAQSFVRHMALFITCFLKFHIDLLENGNDTQRQILSLSLSFLLRISKVKDAVVFKICLDYWNKLVTTLYATQKLHSGPNCILSKKLFPPMSQRVQFYHDILYRLRMILISKMAKPEEVLIVEDENGEIIREQMKDTDSITLYKNMRACLIYLTHLDPFDTQNTLVGKLNKQVDGSEWSWHNLNTLCWAIGSISGAMRSIQEKAFLVIVIKKLLGLCETKRGKDNKAIIASNIMYVVGQYPQFLRQHWKFLKTVINKLFEFMHERHPGVQDMSCDTFLKIAKKCRKKFVTLQKNESQPFIEEILEGLPKIIQDLDTSQIHTFYEAVGNIIYSQGNPEKRQELVFKLMRMPNQSWSRIIIQAQPNQKILLQENIVKQIILIIKINKRVSGSLGYGYIVQLARIFIEILQIYKIYSEYVSNRIQQEGVGVTKLNLIRNMRTVKKEILKLIHCFLQKCQNSQKQIMYNKFLPPLMKAILEDYKQNVPYARDPEVLLLFSAIISKLGSIMIQHIPAIFDAVFQCTLDMITKNFQDYPEHRSMFFELLRAINNSCFASLLRLNPTQFQLIIDSVVWAFKHLERNIAEAGLNILLELIKNMEKATEIASKFYKSFFMSLLQDLLGVLTDTFHKSSFLLHSTILANLFRIVVSGSITIPLWDEGNFPDNQAYIQERTVFLLITSFQNLTRQQVVSFVVGMFKLHNTPSKFKIHLRDFLIQSKEFSNTDNADLYLEEQQKRKKEEMDAAKARTMNVPGLLYTGPSSGN